MLNWLVAKAWLSSAWKSFVIFCKERWELVVGVLVGVLSVVALRNRSQEKSLEKIAESGRNLRDENIRISEETSDKIVEAISEHKSREEQIEEEHREKSEDLDRKERDLRKEILEKERTEPGTIAREINKIVD